MTIAPQDAVSPRSLQNDWSTVASGLAADIPSPQIEVSSRISRSSFTSALSRARSSAVPGRCAMPLADQDELLRADPAGNALAARLVAEESRSVQGVVEHVHAFGQSIHGQAGAEHEVQGAELVDVERQLADVERVAAGREAALEPGRRRRTW